MQSIRAQHPFWNGDFATGDWSQYSDCRRNHVDGHWPTDYAIDTRHGKLGRHRCEGSLPNLVHDISPPQGFRYAARYTVRSGNSSYTGESGERALDTVFPTDHDAGVTGKTRAYQGADTWYRDEIYFPASFRPTRNNDWNWLYELHNYPDQGGDANLALMVATDSSDGGPRGHERLSVRILGGGSPAHPIDPFGSDNFLHDPAVRQHWFRGPSLHRGRWYDCVWHIRWDWRANRSGGRGFAQYWLNGREIGSYHGPTLFYYRNNGTGHGGPGQAYLQHGYYRPADSEAGYAQPTVTVYQAATMIGPTARSIGERLR